MKKSIPRSRRAMALLRPVSIQPLRNINIREKDKKTTL